MRARRRGSLPALLLAPGRTVLFGGGAVGLPVPAFADDGRIGDGLANAGDVVVVGAGHTATSHRQQWGNASRCAAPGAP